MWIYKCIHWVAHVKCYKSLILKVFVKSKNCSWESLCIPQKPLFNYIKYKHKIAFVLPSRKARSNFIISKLPVNCYILSTEFYGFYGKKSSKFYLKISFKNASIKSLKHVNFKVECVQINDKSWEKSKKKILLKNKLLSKKRL